jgi:hypothetical protein
MGSDVVCARAPHTARVPQFDNCNLCFVVDVNCWGLSAGQIQHLYFSTQITYYQYSNNNNNNK